jgi:hypothetical protein
MIAANANDVRKVGPQAEGVKQLEDWVLVQFEIK